MIAHEDSFTLEEKLEKARRRSWYFKVDADDRFAYICRHPPPSPEMNTYLARESRYARTNIAFTFNLFIFSWSNVHRKRFEYEKSLLGAELRRGNKETIIEDLRVVNLGLDADKKGSKLVSRHGRQVACTQPSNLWASIKHQCLIITSLIFICCRCFVHSGDPSMRGLSIQNSNVHCQSWKYLQNRSFGAYVLQQFVGLNMFTNSLNHRKIFRQRSFAERERSHYSH